MKHVHIVIPDLFLPNYVASNVYFDFKLPALEKILARGMEQSLSAYSLEAWLCQTFALPELAIAPVTLMADGVAHDGKYWMRADPVHLRLQRSEMILQTNVELMPEEVQQLCESFNRYFADSAMRLFVPHPKRWYLQLDTDPQLDTHPVNQVEGRDSRFYLPKGNAALKWHAVMNEIQMFLYSHPIKQACEARGDLPVNSLWLWGGGRTAVTGHPFDKIFSDSELVKAFASVSNISHSDISSLQEKHISTLYVWEGASVAIRRGDYLAWKQSVQDLEKKIIFPSLNCLRAGEIDKITLEVVQEGLSKRFELNRANLWKFWKRPHGLEYYALV